MNPTAVLLHQSVWTLLASVLIEYAKNAKWFPLLTSKTVALNRLVAVIGSGVAAFGVHAAFNNTAGVLTITGLTTAGILAGGKEWIRTFLIQEIGYQNLIRGKIGTGSNGGGETPPQSLAGTGQAVPLPIPASGQAVVTPTPQH